MTDPDQTPDLEPGGGVSPGATPPAEAQTSGLSAAEPEPAPSTPSPAAIPIAVIVVIAVLLPPRRSESLFSRSSDDHLPESVRPVVSGPCR